MTATKGRGSMVKNETPCNEQYPYEKENAAEEIFKVICTYPIEQLKQKHFYDIR